MTHLSRDTLIGWRDHPNEADRLRVVSHLAECEACAAQLAELMRTRPVDVQPGRALDPTAFVARGHAAIATAGHRPRWRGWIAGALAMAALVSLAVLIVRDRREPAIAVTRGVASLQALAPAGTVSRVEAFVWDSPDTTSSFRLEVFDGTGRVIYEGRVTDRRAAVPPELAPQLRPGGDYGWMVSRLDSRGSTIESSPMIKFTLAK